MSDNLKIIGEQGLVEQPPVRGWNAQQGRTITRTWEGPAAVVRAEFARMVELDGAGATEITETFDGALGTLIARTEQAAIGQAGSEQRVATIWEARRAEILKPIESHLAFKSLDAQKKREISRAVEDAVPFVGETDAEKRLYAYLCNQITEYPEFSINLKKTEVVTKKSVVVASWQGINRVVTLESIRVPGIIFSALPNNWDWLYKGADVQVTGRNYQIVSEWIGAREWADIYGGSWKPVVEE